MTYYLDASAATKLLVAEAESEALRRLLAQLPEAEPLISSALLETELHRAGTRLDLDHSQVNRLLTQVSLIEPDRSLLLAAGLLPGRHLRSLDGIHVATAHRYEATVLGYDHRLLEAAAEVGLETLSPT